jgi:hypothetical protein
LNIHIGPLPWSIDDSGLDDFFAAHGKVDEAQATENGSANSRRFD